MPAVRNGGAINGMLGVGAWVALAGLAAVTAAMVRKLFTVGQDQPSRSA